MQVARGRLAALEWAGLFDSSFPTAWHRGGPLYAQALPAEATSPLFVVHGLFSSPRAWIQTINELQNNPSIAARYQFWLFMYPTGRPIPGSAVSAFRQALIHARDTLDNPDGSDAALDRTVLVGHSMGGVLSKMMAQDSELTALERHDHGTTRPVQGSSRVQEKPASEVFHDLSPRPIRKPVGVYRNPSSR